MTEQKDTWQSLSEATARIWSGEMLEKLKEFNNKAMSGSRIAAEINGLFGTRFSRSAIIGARHRAGLTLPEKSTWTAEQRAAHSGGGYRRTERHRKAESQRGKWQRVRLDQVMELYKDAPAIEDLFIPLEQRQDLGGLTKQNCHWPVGYPRSPDFFFCGGVAVEGRSYCASHCKVAYMKPGRPNPNFRLQNLSVSV